MNIQKDINKTVLVTGSSRGIGKQIANDFDQMGHTVIYHGSSEKSFDETFDNSRKTIMDFRNVQNVSKWYSQLFEEYDGIDVLILNAGIGIPEDVLSINDSYLDEVVKVNILSQIYLVTEHLRLVSVNGVKGTNVIYISSQAAYYPRTQFPLYAMSKHAMSYYMEILSNDYMKHNTRINVVAPGSIKTDMTSKAIKTFAKVHRITEKEAEMQLYSGINNMKQMGSTKDVSQLVRFLVSEDATFINGEVIRVNGGYHFE